MESVGGKAAALLRLEAITRVPPFLVLTADWIRQESDLQLAVVTRIDAKALRAPYAVRSSAEDEDGTNAAYAGMFETRLGVQPADLADAVRRVAQSGSSARVDSYRSALGLEGTDGAVHVIVQEMVSADTAGVAFSRHPTVPDAIMIEAVVGVGDVLVAGEAQPEAITVDRRTKDIVARSPGRQYMRIDVAGERTRLAGTDVTDERLTNSEARAIGELVVSLERHFPEAKRGVDVEWAVAAGELFCLQCRPITTSSSGVPN